MRKENYGKGALPYDPDFYDSNWTPASLMPGKKLVAYWEGVKREDTKVGNGCVLPRVKSIEVAGTY